MTNCMLTTPPFCIASVVWASGYKTCNSCSLRPEKMSVRKMAASWSLSMCFGASYGQVAVMLVFAYSMQMAMLFRESKVASHGQVAANRFIS